MTLIAAFKQFGVPVLVGDFLLTDRLPNRSNNFLPTAPITTGAYPLNGSARIHGVRKKIHIIGDRLAVGFAGSLYPGTYLMKKIRDRFGQGDIAVRDLEKFLREENFQRKAEAELIGWIWENRPLCFHWRGNSPDELKIVDEVYTGSGGAHFRDHIVGVPNFNGFSTKVQSAVEKAKYFVTCQVGKLLHRELIDAENIAHAYGAGAEVIVWDGARFKYVDDALFFYLEVLIGASNEINLGMNLVVSKYTNRGEYSIIQTTYFQPKNAPSEGIEANNTFVQVITPIYDEMKKFDVTTVGRQSLEAEINFCAIKIVNSAKDVSGIIYMTEEGSGGSDPIVEFRNELFKISMKKLIQIIPPCLLN